MGTFLRDVPGREIILLGNNITIGQGELDHIYHSESEKNNFEEKKKATYWYVF